MTDMKKGINVMSVELAIQRELAYRRKMAAFQSPSAFKFCRDLIPMEVQSSISVPIPIRSPRLNLVSSPIVSGIKWKAITDSRELVRVPTPHELENRMEHSFCKVCQVWCSGFFNYKQHIEGKKHKLKLQELKFGSKDHEMRCAVANPRPWCDLCKIWCMNEDALKAHMEGQKHAVVLAKMELAMKNGKETVIQQTWCELCNINCSDELLLNMHFNGKKHKAELQKLESARKEGTEIVKQQFQCEMCNIWCTDKDALNMHLKGKKHFLKLHRV